MKTVNIKLSVNLHLWKIGIICSLNSAISHIFVNKLDQKGRKNKPDLQCDLLKYQTKVTPLLMLVMTRCSGLKHPSAGKFCAVYYVS